MKKSSVCTLALLTFYTMIIPRAWGGWDHPTKGDSEIVKDREECAGESRAQQRPLDKDMVEAVNAKYAALYAALQAEREAILRDSSQTYDRGNYYSRLSAMVDIAREESKRHQLEDLSLRAQELAYRHQSELSPTSPMSASTCMRRKGYLLDGR